jgi:hypothetical protein
VKRGSCLANARASTCVSRQRSWRTRRLQRHVSRRRLDRLGPKLASSASSVVSSDAVATTRQLCSNMATNSCGWRLPTLPRTVRGPRRGTRGLAAAPPRTARRGPGSAARSRRIVPAHTSPSNVEAALHCTTLCRSGMHRRSRLPLLRMHGSETCERWHICGIASATPTR